MDWSENVVTTNVDHVYWTTFTAQTIVKFFSFQNLKSVNLVKIWINFGKCMTLLTTPELVHLFILTDVYFEIQVHLQ